MADIRFRGFASIENSRCGRRMEQFSRISAASDKSVKGTRAMNSNCLAVFAASLQRIYEVKAVSRSLTP